MASLGEEKNQVFDSCRDLLTSHLFIATEGLTALSVTLPAELIKQAGWTLPEPSSSDPSDWEGVNLRPSSSWEENLTMNKCGGVKSESINSSMAAVKNSRW